MRTNCHSHLWLLSGTGDGPPLAKAFISSGWKVSVSVVSAQAALSYSDIPLQSLWIGALEGPEGIRKVLEKTKALDYGFDLVIDATHPFANVISSNLETVCLELNQPVIRFERICKTIKEAILIQNFEELKGFNLAGQKLLLAIGSRFLPEAIHYCRRAGAIVFARVLPTVEGLSKALLCDLPQDHLAVLRPLKGALIGEYEAALCRKWGITGLVSRQSGGATQKLWQKIAQEQGLDLWLLARPTKIQNIITFNSPSELFDYILK